MLDNIDKQLIILLQEDSRISITDLSAKVNLSRPSVNERINKLIDKGILKNFSAHVPPESVGLNVSFYIQISDIKVSFNKICDILLSKKCITEIHAVTGKINYIAKGSTRNISEMNALLEELMPYAHINTSIILNTPLENSIIIPVD
nr:Lrp/AsnC family transcriptional regulator [Clostridioides sp.]